MPKPSQAQALKQSTLDFRTSRSSNIPDPLRESSPTTQPYTIPISGVPVQFPFPPYPAQIQMIAKIVQSLKKSENALLESPTGSGKSLALLCGTLAWRQYEIKRLAEYEKKDQDLAAANKRQEWNDYVASHKNPDADIVPVKQQIDAPPSPTPPPLTKNIENDDDEFQPAPIVKRRRFKHTANEPISCNKHSNDLKDTEYGQENEFITNKSHIPPLPKPPTQPTSPSSKGSFKKIPKIYICSRTHKQIEQLIGELKRFTNYRPRMTVLGSREQLCVHPKVSKSTNKSDDCVALLDSASCVYGRQTNQLLGHRTMRPNSGSIWDIEDAVKLGKSTKGCPYYASRSLFDTAELIFCPYNYVIDPVIRHIMDINVKGNIVIFDEAHNIEDIARSVASYEVTETDLRRLQKELIQVIRGQNLEEDHKTIQFIVETLLEWITMPSNSFSIKEYEKHVHIWSGSQIISKLADLHINLSTFTGSIYPAYTNIKVHAEKVLNEKEEKSNTTIDSSDHDSSQGTGIHIQECVSTWGLRHLDGLFMVLGFLFKDGYDRSPDYSMALIKKIHRASNFIKDASWVYKLGFWCHNPGVIFEELSSITHSMILTSGTLSPLDTFASELDTKFPAVLEANHVIDPSQVWVGTIPVGPSGTALKGVYSVMESLQYQDDIGQALLEITCAVPFGVLCFLPSYSTLEKLLKRWKVTGTYTQLEAKKTIFIEPQGDNKQLFQRQLKDYYDVIKQSEQQQWLGGTESTGALFFAVYRGKISEGIDFSNNYCRAVVAVGIPYPNLKDTQVSLKRSYNDTKKRNYPARRVIGGDDWYTIQGYRAINQALGRCIRHKKDWSGIILLEERFKYRKNIDGLSKWIQKLCKIHDQGFQTAITDLQSFIQRRVDIDAGVSVDVDS
ncbi:helicase C-terminal domain-domain-containing protein [Absidia repens]|uniref:DNA 5'-3' helicase n=1 Tax=Absidia repens TaxID=90262 RepID=A0A1X2I8Z6_9FUNG|nr:helicase C-terminal domain-domain-containing protein [Absidia repens]